MIIYRATPFRSYPVLINSILKSTNIKNQEFWSILKPENNVDYNKKLIEEVVPSNVKHHRFNGFLYGAFDSQHLNTKENDFIFSIINHPVDNIYELYARRSRLILEYNNYYKNYMINQNYIPNDWTCKDSFGEKTIKMAKENKILSEEEFIDLFLEEKTINIYCDSIKYKIIDEIIFGYNPKKLNYVGKLSNLNKCYKKINKIFNTNINFPQEIKIKSYIGNYYRRKDLEKLFKDQVEIYENLDELFPE